MLLLCVNNFDISCKNEYSVDDILHLRDYNIPFLQQTLTIQTQLYI